MTTPPRRPSTAVERASAPTLRLLEKVPVWAPIVVVLLALALGAVLPWGWVLTALVAAYLGWMLALSWRALTGVERLMRVAVLTLVVGLVLVQALPR